LVEIVLV